MKIFMGLGNPGEQYAATRHNAGIMLVDKIATEIKNSGDYGWRRHKQIYIFETKEIVLVKTAGYFMNESGMIVNDLKYFNFDLNNFYLAHDDLDIKLGEYKIQKGTGPKVHNGVESVEGVWGSKEFWRVRIGIDNRVQKIAGEEYVLQRFTEEEKQILDKVLEKIADEVIVYDTIKTNT